MCMREKKQRQTLFPLLPHLVAQIKTLVARKKKIISLSFKWLPRMSYEYKISKNSFFGALPFSHKFFYVNIGHTILRPIE